MIAAQCHSTRGVFAPQVWSSLVRSFASFASVDGVPTDAAQLSCSVWDVSFQRGDGVFEVCRVIPSSPTSSAAKPRCLNFHLDRLERSAAAMDLPLPPRRLLEQWIREAAASQGKDDANGIVRCMVTRGGGSKGYGHHLEDLHAPPLTFCMWQPLPPQPESLRLLPMHAPWHPGGGNCDDDWAAIKWLSYGPNLHSTRIAQKRGYDDALLLARLDAASNDDDTTEMPPAGSDDGIVLDGPNWAVAWKRNDGSFCTPSWKGLGLLQSTSCSIALEAAKRLGVPVEEGIYRLSHVERHATALWVMSTTRDLLPITFLGENRISTDDATRIDLLQAMDTIIDEHA